MTYTMEVISQNSPASDSIDQVIEIDMVYAIDVELKQGDAQAKRGDSASYIVTLNRGENADTFAIEMVICLKIGLHQQVFLQCT